MQRRHGGILVAEFVLRPNTALALGTVHSIDEAEAARFFADISWDIGIGEETRWHTWPECKDDEGNQVAHGHGTPASFVKSRSGKRAIWVTRGLVREGKVDTAACCGVVE